MPACAQGHRKHVTMRARDYAWKDKEGLREQDGFNQNRFVCSLCALGLWGLWASADPVGPCAGLLHLLPVPCCQGSGRSPV